MLPGQISRIQLTRFRTRKPSMAIGQSVYICNNYAPPAQLPFPFRLTFTAAIICIEGELKACINQRRLTLTRGDVVVIQDGSIIESLAHSSNLTTISMAFPSTEEEWLFSRLAEKLGTWLEHRSIPLALHLDENLLQRYLSLYNQIEALYKDTSDALRDEVVRGFLSVSVASFLSHPQMPMRHVSSSESRADEVFLRFLDDLQLFATRERTVQFYSDKQCISAKHFSKLIRQASGKLPMEHIRQRVVIEAKTLLRTTDMSIREIADALHFPTDSFFCRYFKHDTGLSPSDYRKN